MFLLASVLDALLSVHSPATDSVLFPYLLWPLANFSMVSSQFMLVAIAFERYDAVLRSHNRNRHRSRIIKYVSGVVVVALLLTASKFFEIRQQHEDFTDEAPTQFECNIRTIMPVGDLMFTRLYMNPAYTVFDSVIYNLLLAGMVPIATLVFLYAKIYRRIRAHKANLDALIANRTNERERKREADLAGIFGGYCITFLVCHTPRVLFFGILMMLNKESVGEPATVPFPPWQLKLFYINPLLVTLNSATNVVIYAYLSAQFREECKKVMLGWWKHCCPSGGDSIKPSKDPTNAVIKTTNV